MANILEQLPQVRRMRAEDLPRLKAAAAADDHLVVAPTHLITRQNEVVGYFSLGAIALLNAWADSRKVRARESLGLLNLAENLAAEMNARAVCLPVAENSPFLSYVEGMGYKKLGWASFNVKVIGG